MKSYNDFFNRFFLGIILGWKHQSKVRTQPNMKFDRTDFKLAGS